MRKNCYINYRNDTKINGIIWIVVAIIQIILGIFVNWICLIVGVLNIISAIQDIIFSGKMLKNPNGIVDKVRPLVGANLNFDL